MIFCVITVGTIESTTVTIAVFEAVFPFTSVAVKVTVFVPTLAQLKLVTSSAYVAIVQLSDEPLLI
ncbi:hypothetical protein D9M72_399200 [compost metagenome]